MKRNNELPSHWDTKNVATDETFDRIPNIGERVYVTMNSVGWGKVVGYFTEQDYLGILVDLEETPSYFTGNETDRIIGVFGAEVDTNRKDG